MEKQLLTNSNDIRVLLITYNGGLFFEEQLASILPQKRLESIHIYDDASDSSFKSKLIEYNSAKNITIHFNSKNLGVVANIKNAIRNNLDAKWLSLSDQDDVWEGEKFERVGQIIDKLTVNEQKLPILIYHDMSVINQQNEKIAPSFWELFRHGQHAHNLKTLLLENFVTGCTTIFNPTLGEFMTTLPIGLKSYHDHWLGLAAFTFGKVFKIDEPLNRYRKHDKNQAFREGVSQKLLFRRLRNIYYMIHPSAHMKEEFEIASIFYDIYHDKMSIDKRTIYKNFLKQKDMSYFNQVVFRHAILR